MKCLYMEEDKSRQFLLYNEEVHHPEMVLKDRNKMVKVDFFSKLSDVLKEGGFELIKIAYIPNSAGTQIVTLGCDMFEITEVANQYAKVLLKEYRGKDLKMPQDVLNAKVSVYLAHFMKFNYELRFESLLTEEEKAHEKENFDVILAPAPGPNETIVAIYDVTNKPYMAFGLNFVDHPDGGEVDVDHK